MRSCSIDCTLLQNREFPFRCSVQTMSKQFIEPFHENFPNRFFFCACFCFRSFRTTDNYRCYEHTKSTYSPWKTRKSSESRLHSGLCIRYTRKTWLWLFTPLHSICLLLLPLSMHACTFHTLVNADWSALAIRENEPMLIFVYLFLVLRTWLQLSTRILRTYRRTVERPWRSTNVWTIKWVSINWLRKIVSKCFSAQNHFWDMSSHQLMKKMLKKMGNGKWFAPWC